jgi:competence protein ComEC
MKHITATLLAAIMVALTPTGAQQALTIYFIDVEGGQSTLVVTPARESLLIDTGFGGFGDRDPRRILSAVQDAKLDHIDYLFLTHFHPDHAGGAPVLAAQIPIGTFIDYGSPRETSVGTVLAFEAYARVRAKSQHLLVNPGDRLPLKGVDADVLSAKGVTISQPLAGAGQPNPACVGFARQPDDPTENAWSTGLRLQFGTFRFLDPGDLSWNKIAMLACPNNLVGQIDVYLVAHHGNADTNVPALLAAIHPRVAIVNNGPTKGGAPAALATLRHLDGLADLWQLHRSRNEGAENAPDDTIANLDDGETGYWLKLTAQNDGRFTIVNGRTGISRNY